MTAITITGNVGKNPELRHTPAGDPVCSFSVAVTERKRNADGTWVDDSTSWYRVTAWRNLAESVAAHVHKGARVVVVGRVKIGTYQTDNGERQSVDVTASDVGMSVIGLNTNHAATAGGATAGGTQDPQQPVAQQQYPDHLTEPF